MTEIKSAYCLQCKEVRRFERRGVNHVLHLLLSVFSLGLWVPLWILLALCPEVFHCMACGAEFIKLPDGYVGRKG
ncbi:MAG: hypothetical protein ISS72_06190 [Candidatus Brocadiae bacterium]|nr:hypothetical protein [Candidatus Brocadiia bacterium]